MSSLVISTNPYPQRDAPDFIELGGLNTLAFKTKPEEPSSPYRVFGVFTYPLNLNRDFETYEDVLNCYKIGVYKDCKSSTCRTVFQTRLNLFNISEQPITVTIYKKKKMLPRDLPGLPPAETIPPTFTINILPESNVPVYLIHANATSFRIKESKPDSRRSIRHKIKTNYVIPPSSSSELPVLPPLTAIRREASDDTVFSGLGREPSDYSLLVSDAEQTSPTTPGDMPPLTLPPSALYLYKK